MSDHPQFEPIFPSHAIERCGAAVTFSEPLPSKAFQRVLEQVQSRFRSAGLEWIAGVPGSRAVRFQIDVASGQTTPIAPGAGPAVFTTTDRSTQFIIAPDSLTARTTSYVRWAPFVGSIEELMLPLVGVYSEVVSAASVQLDYVDRFLWTGDWSSFDWRTLLKADGRFLATKAAKHRLWHNHSGWFEESAQGRRLINVNVDLSDFNRSEGPVPSIAILTLMREDVAPEAPRFGDAPSVQACLEQLHNDLKTLLAHIIIDQMAERISLNAPASDDTRH
jgi:uncharacterized protein (TIGR04255 family)